MFVRLKCPALTLILLLFLLFQYIGSMETIKNTDLWIRFLEVLDLGNAYDEKCKPAEIISIATRWCCCLRYQNPGPLQIISRGLFFDRKHYKHPGVLKIIYRYRWCLWFPWVPDFGTTSKVLSNMLPQDKCERFTYFIFQACYYLNVRVFKSVGIKTRKDPLWI